ncbi:MAG: hypothetical protein R6V54_01725 [Desulfobacteraceae bacterium]
MRRTYASVSTAVEALKPGAYDYYSLPVLIGAFGLTPTSYQQVILFPLDYIQGHG